MAAVSLPASALTINLVSPAEGDVTNDGCFPTVILEAGMSNAQIGSLDMVSKAGETVSCKFDLNWDSGNFEVDCSNVVKSGEWTLKVPAGAFDEDGNTNEAVEFSWN